MKNILLTIISTIALIFGGRTIVSAQTTIKPHAEIGVQEQALKQVSMENYESFKQSVTPLIEKMGVKRIVGLGEGTHGTAEFYKLRFWISRILIEEKGFNHIAFENDFSDCWLLNSQLNSGADLNALMKKYMLSIWQNEETKELLNWVKAYNSSHKTKVTIDGLDYVFITPDVELVKQQLAHTTVAALLDSMAVITKAAAFQDASWLGMNDSTYKVDMDALGKGSYDGYVKAEKLDKLIIASTLPEKVKADCHIAIVNIEQGFAPFYDEAAKLPEASRDSNMATNAGLILKEPGSKMIIWAHEAHLAKKGIYNNEVGGTGGIISRAFPNNYFALGTGTATGTFAATKDPRDTYTNPMAAYSLEIPQAGSWEDVWSNTGKPAFYFTPAAYNPGSLSKSLRFIGYGPDSGPKTSDNTNLSDLFDAFIFIKDTHAATPLK